MISYTLQCANGHSFTSWFQSSEAYEKLEKAGLLCCEECGSHNVKRGIMAPNISTSASREASRQEAKYREFHGVKMEDVGGKFAEEVRAIYNGDNPDRPICGTATTDEVKELVEEGHSIAVLPEEDRSTH
jgi:hypothetical protein